MVNRIIKDLEFRVVLYGRNEYDGSIQCHCVSFSEFDEEAFKFVDGNIHYYPKFTSKSFIPFYSSARYVFNREGVCISHHPKKSKKLPYAEILIKKKEPQNVS